MLNYGDNFIVKYLGIVFVSASLIRIYLVNDRKNELVNIGLPYGFDYIIIISELLVGLFLLFDSVNKLTCLIYLLLFLIVGTIFILFNNFNKIIGEFNQIWTFQPTAMSLVLHFTYIIIIIGLCINLQ